jgi:hypothetical protein
VIGHILERSLLHVLMSGSVYMMAFFVLHFAMRKNTKLTMAVIPALVVVGFIGLREPFDVANGQPLAKVITDYISWGVGMTLALVSLARYRKDVKG